MSGLHATWSEPPPPPLPEFDGVIEPVVAARIAEMEAIVAECDADLADPERRRNRFGALQIRRQWAAREIELLSRGRPVKPS